MRFLLFMRVRINGEERDVADGVSLAGLLESLQIRPGRVVVERNKTIVPRDSYSATILTDGDALEIVHFVGGG
jgi:thiazole synthase/sulfur carrier protein